MSIAAVTPTGRPFADSYALGGAAKVFFLGQGHEMAQVSQLHSRFPVMWASEVGAIRPEGIHQLDRFTTPAGQSPDRLLLAAVNRDA